MTLRFISIILKKVCYIYALNFFNPLQSSLGQSNRPLKLAICSPQVHDQSLAKIHLSQGLMFLFFFYEPKH